MERVVNALIGLIEDPSAFAGKQPEAPWKILPDLAEAPEYVKRLVHAMATRYHNVDLGDLRLSFTGASGVVADLADTIELAAERGDVELETVVPEGFVLGQTLEIASDGGGMSVLGLAWAAREVCFVLVEMDDPTEENLIQRFTEPEALLELLEEKARGRVSPDLHALRAAIR